MLILTRKSGESIVIDGRISVTVVQIDRNTVKLGIQAPPEVIVHRQEIHDAIQRGEQEPLTRLRRSTQPPAPDNPCPSK